MQIPNDVKHLGWLTDYAYQYIVRDMFLVQELHGVTMVYISARSAYIIGLVFADRILNIYDTYKKF